MGIANLRNVAHESTIFDWTEAFHKISTSCCHLSVEIWSGKKENELPVKEIWSANILCTQMLSAEWRQIGQKLQHISAAAKADTPSGIKLHVKDRCSQHPQAQ